MEIAEAQRLARDLLDKHNLKNWEIKFRNARGYVGRCEIHNQRIIFSIYWTEKGSRYEFTDTVVHEMAHALVGYEREAQGHGPKWRAMMQRLGAPPERYSAQKRTTEDAKWQGVCPCGKTKHGMNRRSNRMEYFYCPSCLDRLSWSFKGVAQSV